MKRILLLILILHSYYFMQAQQVHEPSSKNHPEWSKPFPPFRVVGNLYYVGTADLACYLIATPEGNILINTGLASSERLIGENIKKLGFKLSDTKILLTTQAHFDHLGAMAAIKKATGAKFMVDDADAKVAADGGLSDYDLDGKFCVFKPVKVDRILHNNDTIRLGGMELIMLHHPGHTKGSCSFLLSVNDQKRKYWVLIANLPTIVTEKNFADIPAYPNIAKDYAYTLQRMKNLKFDLWVASHGVQFDLLQKHKPGDTYNPAAFMDVKSFYDYIDELQVEYDKKIGKG
ncbi:subclass B3 metallo-beta-lactamase [Pedobacter sp. KBS0701]|uniref:subclass B3 metallo-beta-lactamase n=1 Tax=Pedobacter sp. KBS0701 TaxID=2578106 RepID=UPI00110D2F83|nr:subclass B3 metallo-beta-lactamase [Pedobacter sp. KBS0701]QDW24686.1 subclass B3 metallo-beta-lactamase [Pedobacter sp. KBS0701]